MGLPEPPPLGASASYRWTRSLSVSRQGRRTEPLETLHGVVEDYAEIAELLSDSEMKGRRWVFDRARHTFSDSSDSRPPAPFQGAFRRLKDDSPGTACYTRHHARHVGASPGALSSETILTPTGQLGSRPLTESTKQITPPTKSGHAPPFRGSRKNTQSVNPHPVRIW